MRMWMAAALSAAVVGLGAVRAGFGFSITPELVDGAGQTWDGTEEAVVEAAIDSWTSRLEVPAGQAESTSMTFEFVHGNGELASWTGNPVSSATGSYVTTPGVDHVIDINVDLMDPILTNHLVFTLGDVPFDDWDALSVLRHEIGHAMGFNTVYDDDGGSEWLRHVTIDGSNATFDAGGLNLALDGSGDVVHLSGTGQIADDLMSAFLPNGTRKDVSADDMNALVLAYGYTVVPEPGTEGVAVAGVVGKLLRRRRGGEMVNGK